MADREVNLNLRNGRTTGEKLWLWRMRRELSQAEAAQYLGLTAKQYWKAEADIKDYPINGGPPARILVNRAILCRLARRRYGQGLKITAQLFGISHTTLLQREAAGDPKLVKAWEGLGYSF